jgi:hypothetical protein
MIHKMKEFNQIEFCKKFIYKLAFYHEFMRTGAPIETEFWKEDMHGYDRKLYNYYIDLKKSLLSTVFKQEGFSTVAVAYKWRA